MKNFSILITGGSMKAPGEMDDGFCLESKKTYIYKILCIELKPINSKACNFDAYE